MLRKALSVYRDHGLREVGRRSINTVSGKIKRNIYNALYRKKINEVKQAKSEIDLEHRYEDDPDVSIILQSFNHKDNISYLYNRTPVGNNRELIICEDGSTDRSLHKWDNKLSGRNKIIIRTQDWHEIRTYSRASQYAEGDFLVFGQDDDLPPSHDWVADIRRMFEADAQLGLVGCFHPLPVGPSDRSHSDLYPGSSSEPIRSGQDRYKWNRENGVSFPETARVNGLPYRYVAAVNVGPFITRRSAYDEVGGFDFRYSDPGEPGIEFDRDYSYRLWLNDWKVAFAPLDMHHGAGKTGGTSLWGKEERTSQEKRNRQIIQDRFSDKYEEIAARVAEANNETMEK